MTIVPLGKIVVTTAGTPVQVLATGAKCAAIIVAATAGTTGKVYFGTSTVNKTTLAGAIKEFLPSAATGFADSLTIDNTETGNPLQMSDYWLDSTVNGEGLLVSYVIR